MRLAEPHTFFVDRPLGGDFVAGALRVAGQAVVVQDDEFEPELVTLPQMASTFIAALPRVTKVLRRWDLPIIATVMVTGGVSVLYARATRLQPARLVK